MYSTLCFATVSSYPYLSARFAGRLVRVPYGTHHYVRGVHFFMIFFVLSGWFVSFCFLHFLDFPPCSFSFFKFLSFFLHFPPFSFISPPLSFIYLHFPSVFFMFLPFLSFVIHIVVVVVLLLLLIFFFFVFFFFFFVSSVVISSSLFVVVLLPESYQKPQKTETKSQKQGATKPRQGHLISSHPRKANAKSQKPKAKSHGTRKKQKQKKMALPMSAFAPQKGYHQTNIRCSSG